MVKHLPARHRYLLLAGILLVTLILFSGVLRNGFVNVDDDKSLLLRSEVHGLSHDNLKTLFGRFNLDMYAPLSGLFFSCIYSIAGLNALVFHASSVLLHLVNCMLVFILLRRLYAGNLSTPLLTLLFAIHPVQVEAVAWVSASSTLLFTTFYLLSLIFFLSFREDRSVWRYLLSFLFFILSLLSKSIAVTLPVLLFFLLLIPCRPNEQTSFISLKRRKGEIMKWLLFLLPFFLFSFLTGLLTLHSRNTDIQTYTQTYTLADRFLLVPYTLLFYSGKLLAPINLCLFYPFPPHGHLGFRFWISPLIVILVLVFLFIRYRTNGMLMTGMVLFLLPLSATLPYMTLGQLDFRGDRYLYFPLVGFFLMIAAIVSSSEWNKIRMVRMTFTGIAIVYFIYLGYRTVDRVHDWRDSRSLMVSFLEQYPGNTFALNNLGEAYSSSQQYDLAKGQFKQIIREDPSDCMAWFNLGTLEMNVDKNYTSAISCFDRAIGIYPAYVRALYNRGLAGYHLGNWKKAAADFSQALEFQPAYPDANVSRALCFCRLGDYRRALADYNRALHQDPSNPSWIMGRANTFLMAGRYDSAISDYRLLLAKHFRTAEARHGLAVAYISVKKSRQAIENVDSALALDPGNALYRNTKGYILLKNGMYPEAIFELTRSILADSVNAYAFNNRAEARLALQDYTGAWSDVLISLRINPSNGSAWLNRARIGLHHNTSRYCDDLDSALKYGAAGEDLEILKKYCGRK